jgi:hypothetical protein
VLKIYIQGIEWGTWPGLIWRMIQLNGSKIEGDFLTGFSTMTVLAMGGDTSAVAQLK